MANDKEQEAGISNSKQKSKQYVKWSDKRKNTIKALNHLVNKIKDMPKDSSKIDGLSRLAQLAPLQEKYNTIMRELEESEEFDYDELEPSNDEITELFFTANSTLQKLTSEPINMNSTLFQQTNHEVKLPRIEIPTFNGKYQEWTAFYDSFTSLIDNNPKLSDVSKMHYLRNCLSGTALRLINTLPVTETNYKLAWALLCDRFHNNRAIINACLASFFNQSAIKIANASSLRTLIDTTRESLQCIETLDINIENWDPITVFIIQSKLDTATLKEWEHHLGGSTETPKYTNMMRFLETQWRVLDTTNENNNPITAYSTANTSAFTRQNLKQKDPCVLCKNEHWLYFCPTFNNYSITQRKKFVSDNSLCTNCFQKHKDTECRNKHKCKKCNATHNTKLHEDQTFHPNTSSHTFSSIQKDKVQPNNGKILATAIVKVKDKHNITHLLRAFIDNGSEGAMISERASQLLCLPQKREHVPLTGIDNALLGTAKKSVHLDVESCVNSSFKFSTDTLVMKSIISAKPYLNEQQSWKHLDNLPLADPEYLSATEIDLLFGVDIYGLIVLDGLRKGKVNEPIAQNSELGWLVFGATATQTTLNLRMHTISLSDQLRKFWENEEVQLNPIHSEEHQQCIDHYTQNVQRLENGQIMVALPFNMNPNESNFLGNSEYIAKKRFLQTEQRCKRDPLYRQRYNEEMQSYIDSNQMTLCDDSINDGYIIPHHAVIKEQSTSTKQRTVYDASAKTSNGFSLNDRLLNGPTIQPELFDTFIRWRIYKIALVADVKQMFRRILVRPEDRKYQQILFRFSENEPIKKYQLNTVTFGMKPSPYLAIRSTFKLADDEKDSFPNAAERIKTDMYVDDCMSGEHSVEKAKILQIELNELAKSGQMLFCKWASNNEAALEGIPIEHRAIDTSFDLSKNATVKTLGMHWTPDSDDIHFKIDMKNISTNARITKRKLLSDASKLYDPCGLLSPIIIKSKIMMQELWKSGIEWDQLIHEEIQNEWNQYKSELPLIENIKINRWFETSSNSCISLHGFCDSSERAYAAVIYIVQTNNNVTTSHIICSKTRVAPINFESIPRLELNGAVLLAELMTRVATNLRISSENVYLWTDSSIVLTWLNSHASKWQTYVARRISDIHKNYEARHWRHVRTHENPADIASRGCFASFMIDNKLWFNGPEWLLLTPKDWPLLDIILPSGVNLEPKPHTIRTNTVVTNQSEYKFLLHYSSLNRLFRATVYILRFIQFIKTKKIQKGIVSANEYRQAKSVWIRYVQSFHFTREIDDLNKKKFVHDKSTLKQLNPQLNSEKILVVNGRLSQSHLPERQKFPVILPAKSHFSKLIIDHAHQSTLHGTIHLTLAKVRQQFWILNARNLVKSHIHHCIACYRQNPRPLEQLMAPLPTIKTIPARAFIHCGLDFAGPIEIKSSNRRNAPVDKGYICVFVCMVSKAIHLECVSDLSTKYFILALRRMMTTRGICSDIYCDNGLNFVGASNELPKLFLQASSAENKEITSLFATDGTTFHFNPPNAPNWGGQWESFVKLTKHHLKRMNTSVKLTFEEMSTLLSQIAACINSRPLCAMTSDINDLDPLTAGHLLIGTPLNLIPEPSLLSLKENTLDRFQAIQKSLQIFWKRFYIEYLHNFHPRKKWFKQKRNLEQGDLVVIIDDNLPPAKWLMARVIEIHPSSDELIRLATLKTKTTTLQRPINKLCRLPVGPEDVPDRTLYFQ